MKKILLSIGALALTFAVNAQTFFSESFDSSIPGTWTIVDVDNHTSSSSQSAYASWAWNSGAEDASSSSWYNNSGLGPTDDWLITPQITVPATGTNYLFFFGASHEANFLEEYEVLISTTGASTTDFTNNELSVNNEPLAGTDHAIDISSYNGQNIYIAFHHTSDDESMLHIDDVVCTTLLNSDMKIDGIAIDNRIEGNKTFTITCRNYGATTVNAFDLDWDFSGSGSTTENITGLSLTTNQTHDVVVNVNSVAANLGQTFNADITTSDDDNANNTATDDFDIFEPIPNFTGTSSTGTAYDLHTALSNGQAIVLDFMASWCGPCQSSTPELSELVENNGSGNGNIESYAITVESTDNSAALNALNWNGGFYSYPKFPYDNSSYATSTAFQYGFYNTDHGLNSGSIPFFVMICPNTSDPGNSTIVKSDVGFSAGMFGGYQTALDACPSATNGAGIIADKLVSDLTIYPNPSVINTNVQFNVNYASNVEVQVVNMLGQVVYTNSLGTVQGQQIVQIETADLEGGMYLVNINVNGEIISERITVAK